MLFSSIPFLFYFLPIVLIVYFLTPNKFKNTVLLLSSLVFYGWGEPKYLILMVLSIVLFYLCGIAIGKSETQKKKKFWLCVSVVMSVLLLGVFKYADFFVSNFNAVTGLSVPLLKLALPIGISFYTFQCLSYTIDVYRGEAEAQKNLINFGAYVSLFPQLIAGPIVRYVDVARELENRKHTTENFTLGLRRFLVGLAKKIILANSFGELVSIFKDSDEKSVVFYWIYAVAFTLHIYFDFSGYSDMAIGLGKIFGFNFVENFNYPYMSASIQEFWRRWHISLGSWFRDYVYIPLGGNRVGKMKNVFNILVVWMLTGLWHGASWNFVIWGLMYALLLLFEKFVPIVKKMPKLLAHVYTMLFVILGFVIFDSENMSSALSIISGMFGFGDVPLITAETTYYLKSYAVIFIFGAIGSTCLLKNIFEKLQQMPKVANVINTFEVVFLFAILIVCSAYLVDGSFNPFLYFRF